MSGITLQKIEVVNLDILNLSDSIKILDSQRKMIEESVGGIEQTLLIVKSNFETQLAGLKERLEKKIDSIETSIRSSDSNIKQINRKIESISNELSEIDYLAKRSERVTIDHEDKIVNIQKTIFNNKKDLQDSIEKLRNSMIGQSKDQKDSFKKLKKYLENDYKVSINLSLMDHLYNITTDPKSLNRLAQYEKDKLQD